MLLITLDRVPAKCRIELDGVDISQRLCRIEVDAELDGGLTLVRLTIVDDVTIAGAAGVLEFVKRPRTEAQP
jgi:hypothetical protein